MDSRKAEGMRFTINLITPDNGEKFLVELENATLDFDPRFEIMPGTKARTAEVAGYVESGITGKPDPYEAILGQTIAE